MFAVARGHPLAKTGHPLTPADIENHRAVVVRDSSRELPALTRRVFEKQTVLRVANIQQKIDAQVHEQGVGFLPKFRIEQLISSGDLVALELAEPVLNSPLHLAWKANNKGKALKWFVDRLLKE